MDDMNFADLMKMSLEEAEAKDREAKAKRVGLLMSGGLSLSDASLVDDLSTHAFMEAVKTLELVLDRLPPHLKVIAAIYTYRMGAANMAWVSDLLTKK